MKEVAGDPSEARSLAQLELLLLGVLAREPLHGYAIIAGLRERSGGLFDLNEGTVYPALHRLERTGLVESDWTAVGGRRRRVYRLTRSGRRSLATERTAWQRMVQAVSSVLAAPERARRRTP